MARSFRELLAKCPLDRPGQYRVWACAAKKQYSSTGRVMYVVTLVVNEGPCRGRFLKWNLVVVQENPELLHKFFTYMAMLGVTTEDYARATSHEDITNKINETEATLDVALRPGRGGYLDVVDARRVIEE